MQRLLDWGTIQKGDRMQLKTLLAMAVTAAAVPLGASWATEPTGPQGTFLGNNPHRLPAFSAMDRNADNKTKMGSEQML
ncbi:MAG: hypothetical protein A3G81_10280 [Betaproteobacteria bacterium RIFCSPLOWO2_12_FULL_65_14]|nr:MAG: hypothetical protein A3G81_10280 [Betaproteobacteria bacterium RIFCSPLOWO2_12_FULL_65_14]